MKVVVSGYVGKKITGIGRNLISLLNASESNTEFVVYVNEDMRQDFEFTNPNVTVKTYPVTKTSSMKNLLWTTFVFPFKVLKERADRGLIPNFTLLLLKFKPTYVIMHDLIEYNVPNKFSKLKMFYRTKLANPITAKLADKIITVSENSRRDIVKFLKVKPEKIQVVYNGVDQNKFHRMSEKRALAVLEGRNWPQDFLLYAGTLDHPGKNAMTVVKVFEILKKRGKYTGKLVLAGMPGSGYDVLEDYIKKSEFCSDIVLTGFVTDEELVALYSKCRVFMFLSLYEGFGIPPLEAIACGAKTIVSSTSSLPEVVGNVGVSVDPLDTECIAEVVETMLQQSCDAEYLELVQCHLKNYQWPELSKKFVRALENK